MLCSCVTVGCGVLYNVPHDIDVVMSTHTHTHTHTHTYFHTRETNSHISTPPLSSPQWLVITIRANQTEHLRRKKIKDTTRQCLHNNANSSNSSTIHTSSESVLIWSQSTRSRVGHEEKPAEIKYALSVGGVPVEH